MLFVGCAGMHGNGAFANFFTEFLKAFLDLFAAAGSLSAKPAPVQTANASPDHKVGQQSLFKKSINPHMRMQ